MDIATFSQLGIGLATLLILWIVVRYFIEALTKKDAYIEKVVDQFNTTINNHIDHQTKAADETNEALHSLTKAVDKMSRLLVTKEKEARE